MLDINPSITHALLVNIILATFIFAVGALLIVNIDKTKGAFSIFFGIAFLIVAATSISMILYNAYCIYLIISAGVDTGKDWATLIIYAVFLISSFGSGITAHKQ